MVGYTEISIGYICEMLAKWYG